MSDPDLNKLTRDQRRARGLPSRRKMDRLGLRADTTGCDRCHALIVDLAPYFICRVPGGKFEVRCPPCSKLGGAKPKLGGVSIGCGVTAPPDPWVAADKAWFASHPKRAWRLRPPLLGEVEDLLRQRRIEIRDPAAWAAAERQGLRMVVAVHEFEPGARIRVVAVVPRDKQLSSYSETLIVRVAQDTGGLAEIMAADIPRVREEAWKDQFRTTIAALAVSGCVL